MKQGAAYYNNWLRKVEASYYKDLMAEHRGFAIALAGDYDTRVIQRLHYQRKIKLKPSTHIKGADVICELEAMPFEPNTLDAIILAHELDYAQRANQVFEEVTQALRPQGLLLISGLNPWRPFARRLWRINNGHKHGKAPHMTGQLHIMELAQKHQLHVLQTRRYGFIVPPQKDPHRGANRRLDFIGVNLCPWLSVGYMLLLQKRTISVGVITPSWQDLKEPEKTGVITSSNCNRTRHDI